MSRVQCNLNAVSLLVLVLLFIAGVALIGKTFGLFKEYGESATEPRQQINRIIAPTRPTPKPYKR